MVIKYLFIFAMQKKLFPQTTSSLNQLYINFKHKQTNRKQNNSTTKTRTP